MLFIQFNQNSSIWYCNLDNKNYKGYRLLAIYVSGLSIAYNSKDANTYIYKKNMKEWI